jgi:hypothetical protein
MMYGCVNEEMSDVGSQTYDHAFGLTGVKCDVPIKEF